MDEPWVHQYTPELDHWSAEWAAAGEPRPKRPNTHQSADNVLLSVFCHMQESSTLKKATQSTATITRAFERGNTEKWRPYEKHFFSPRQSTV